MKDELNNDEFIAKLKDLLTEYEISNYSMSFLKENMVQHSQYYTNGMQMVGILEHGKRIILKKLEGEK